MRLIPAGRPARRSLTEHDRASWAAYAQTVSPLLGVAIPPAPAAPPEPQAAPLVLPPPPTPRLSRRPEELVVGQAPGGVDRSTWTRFRTGKLPALRTLDLHGRTAQRAHAALHDFLIRAATDGTRCVEVITGRGSGEGGGVIRREFPLWLNAPGLRPLVLAASHPHAANTGSVRLLLRRLR